VTATDHAPQPPDAELIAALGTGGEPARPAWAALVARYSPRMYAVARSFAVDPAVAEDLVQTAWLRLLERGDQLRDPAAVGPWLCMIVRNEARRYVTRHREIPAALPVEGWAGAGWAGEGDAAEAGLIRAERARALRLAFARLGEECQRLLRLLVAEPPLSYDEIAAAVNRPRGSLGPTRRRCLERLRAHLPAGFEP